MNKHFSAILAIMDAAEIVPDEIRFTESRDILITSDLRFDCGFYTSITKYCEDNELEYERYPLPQETFLIKNPKNI